MPIVETLAAGLLPSLLKPMVEDVSKKFSTYLRLTGKTKDEIEALLKTYNQIQQLINRTNMSDVWLNEVAQSCYEAEDILDDIKPAGMKQPSILEKMPPHVKRIQKLRFKLEKMLSHQLDPEQVLATGHSQSRALEPGRCELKRDEQKKIIVDQLRSHHFGVSIIGMFGIGKSTLAYSILNDASLKVDFPVTQKHVASGDFKAESAIEDLSCQQLPKDQRVLILLDGVQTIPVKAWDLFRVNYFDKLKSGSKILITSRNQEVANVTGTRKHQLHPLTAEECSRLIRNYADVNGNLSTKDVQVIEHNQTEMACKCKGSPLLACHMGLLLSAAENRRKKVIQLTETDLWKLITSEKILPHIVPVFQPHSKRYLAYCSLFPQDHTFMKDSIVELWIAEGLVQVTAEDAWDLEQTNKHFDELCSYSVFQLSELPAGEEGSYKMYELVHYLAQNIAPKIFRRIHAGTSNSTSSLNEDEFSDIRHMSLTCGDIQDTTEKLLVSIMKKSKGLRTFLLFNRAGQNITKNPTFFTSLKRLRVLDLSHTNLTDLVANVSELKHLRYLDLSNTPIVKLTSLTKIFTLRVLKLNSCNELLCLPHEFSNLTNLVCLQVNIRGLDSMPPNIGKLRNLETLDVFTVGEDNGYKITELKNMNSLRKSICITRLENVENEYEAKEAMLNQKKQLETLELEWCTTTTDANSAKSVLECLEPPKNLLGLVIRKYHGPEFPLWLGKLAEVCRCLVAIELDHCKACTILPSFGQLPSLETLRIAAMPELQQVGDEFFGEGCSNDQSKAFQALKLLQFSDLPKLTQWEELRPGCMPLLGELHIHNCQGLETLPSLNQLTSLKDLSISKCTRLKDLPTLPPSLKKSNVSISGSPGATSAYNNRAFKNEEASSQNNVTPKTLGSDQENHTSQYHRSLAIGNQNEVPSVAPDTSEPVHETSLQLNQDQGRNGDQQTSPKHESTIPDQINGKGQHLQLPKHLKSSNGNSAQKPSSLGIRYWFKVCFSSPVVMGEDEEMKEEKEIEGEGQPRRVKKQGKW